MRVKELIEALSKLDPELYVIVEGTEDFLGVGGADAVNFRPTERDDDPIRVVIIRPGEFPDELV